jgi:hypothetical protein
MLEMRNNRWIEIERRNQFELIGGVIKGKRPGKFESIVANSGERFAQRIAIESYAHESVPPAVAGG